MNQLQTIQPTDLTAADDAAFSLAQRKGKLLSCSDLVPRSYQGNVPNCVVALEMAHRMNASCLMVMQSLFVIGGKPSWSSAYLIGCFNMCGRFEPISYEFSGQEESDSWGCRAVSKVLATGKEIRGPLVTIKMAKAEGWHNRAGSKWKTMPELMLQYRAAAFMIRTTAPEITLGFQTSEEVQDANATQEAAQRPTSEILADPTLHPEYGQEPVEAQAEPVQHFDDKGLPSDKPKKPRKKRRSKAEIWQDKVREAFGKCGSPQELDAMADKLEQQAETVAQAQIAVEVYNQIMNTMLEADANGIPHDVVPDGEMT